MKCIPADSSIYLALLPRFASTSKKGFPVYQKNFVEASTNFFVFTSTLTKQVVEAVKEAGDDDIVLDGLLGEIFPEDLKVRKWNHEITHKGQTEAGRAFIKESLEQMGVPELEEKILCIMDMMDLDEGRLPAFVKTNVPNGKRARMRLHPQRINSFESKYDPSLAGIDLDLTNPKELRLPPARQSSHHSGQRHCPHKLYSLLRSLDLELVLKLLGFH